MLRAELLTLVLVFVFTKTTCGDALYHDPTHVHFPTLPDSCSRAQCSLASSFLFSLGLAPPTMVRAGWLQVDVRVPSRRPIIQRAQVRAAMLPAMEQPPPRGNSSPPPRAGLALSACGLLATLVLASSALSMTGTLATIAASFAGVFSFKLAKDLSNCGVSKFTVQQMGIRAVGGTVQVPDRACASGCFLHRALRSPLPRLHCLRPLTSSQSAMFYWLCVLPPLQLGVRAAVSLGVAAAYAVASVVSLVVWILTRVGESVLQVAEVRVPPCPPPARLAAMPSSQALHSSDVLVPWFSCAAHESSQAVAGCASSVSPV